jgi:RNA polymerase sigma-70 factor (ECF subfamily)
MLALMVASDALAADAPDLELARRIAATGAGARAAEEVLFRRYGARIRLYGLKHLGSRAAADDLVQLVMLRVVEAIRAGRVEDPTNLASFIFGTCRHASWDLRRSDQRQRKIEEAHHGLLTDAVPLEHSERDVARLFGCLGKLPEREAMVLRMSFMEDREADEIGERLGISSGNVRVIRCRALAKMAGCMGEERAP